MKATFINWKSKIDKRRTKMKKLFILVYLFLTACTNTPNNTVPLENDDQKMSYAVGHMTGKMFQGLLQEQELDNDQFFTALRDTAELREDELIMDQDSIKKYMKMHEMKVAEIQKRKALELAEKNKEAGDNFREANSRRPQVTTLSSGIQYEKIISANGTHKPTMDSTVVAHYHGEFVDGTVFDSSVDRGEPATFPVANVIQGWQEVLVLMSEGEKWRIVIPPEMAYGEQGQGMIGPNQTLIFDLELVSIN